MTTKTAFLVAVLVPASATTDTIDTHLADPMRYLMPGVVGRYRLGGRFTGAWDVGYDPRTDPANWRPCSTCAATGRVADQACPQCGDAQQHDRAAATVLTASDDWVAHSGDLVPLSRVLDPRWRFPTSDTADSADDAVPDLWADRCGTVWLSGTLSGETPTELGHVLRSLLDGSRRPDTDGEPFDPVRWQVAIVEGRCTSKLDRAVQPVVGSVVLITDSDWVEDDADPTQLYVVSDDTGAPCYQLVRLGGYGPQVPGYAITEIDPARVRLVPAHAGAPPYPPRP